MKSRPPVDVSNCFAPRIASSAYKTVGYGYKMSHLGIILKKAYGSAVDVISPSIQRTMEARYALKYTQNINRKEGTVKLRQVGRPECCVSELYRI